jgi:hypothetical protein
VAALRAVSHARGASNNSTGGVGQEFEGVGSQGIYGRCRLKPANGNKTRTG